jgi:hypothetical protein
MSDLEKLTAAGNTDALPGHTISPPGLREIGEAEAHFGRSHIADAAASAAGLDTDVRDVAIDKATARVARREFNYYGNTFKLCCLSAEHFPFLMWLSLRVEKPKITQAQAAALITPENQPIVTKAVLDVWGFDTGKNAEAGEAKQSQSKSTGADSLPSSANTEVLPTSKSAA